MTRACFSENKFYNSVKHKFTIKKLLTEKVTSIIKKLLYKHLFDFPVLTDYPEYLRIQVVSLMIKYRIKKNQIIYNNLIILIISKGFLLTLTTSS